MSLLVLDVVGLTPRLLPHMPNLRKMAEPGFTAQLDTVFPAVTCPTPRARSPRTIRHDTPSINK